MTYTSKFSISWDNDDKIGIKQYPDGAISLILYTQLSYRIFYVILGRNILMGEHKNFTWR